MEERSWNIKEDFPWYRVCWRPCTGDWRTDYYGERTKAFRDKEEAINFAIERKGVTREVEEITGWEEFDSGWANWILTKIAIWKIIKKNGKRVIARTK